MSFVKKLSVLLILAGRLSNIGIINILYFMKYVLLYPSFYEMIVHCLLCCFECSYWTGHNADNTMSLPNIFWKWAGVGGKSLQARWIHKSENFQVRWFWNWTALSWGWGEVAFPFLVAVNFGSWLISFLVLQFHRKHIKMRVEPTFWEERSHCGAASWSVVSRSCTCFLGHGFGRSLTAGISLPLHTF